jgi:hypothetical protein
MAIICKPCAAKIEASENPADRRCPDEDCDEADELSFAVQEFSSAMMIKQLEENTLQHSCRKKSDKSRSKDDVQTYTVLELFDHLLNVCLKK